MSNPMERKGNRIKIFSQSKRWHNSTVQGTQSRGDKEKHSKMGDLSDHVRTYIELG